MLPIALDGTLPASLTERFLVSSEDALNYTRWHTPGLLDCTLPIKLSRHSQLHSMVHSWPAWLYAPKWALRTLPIALDGTLSACLTVHSQLSFQDALNCTRWYTPIQLDCMLPCELSRRIELDLMAHCWPAWLDVSRYTLKTLRIALDGTLPAFLTLRSQVSSQDALNHTAKYALKYIPNWIRWHTPSLLDYTLPSTHPRCSQVHFQEARHSQSHLTVYFNVYSCMFDAETYWVAAARYWKAGGGRQEAGCGMQEEGGGRREACGGGRNHDGCQYASSNVIFSTATATRSHDASWLWWWHFKPEILQER